MATYSVVDSAGIEIVTSHAPRRAQGAGWAISRRPTLRIGELDGPLEFTFGSVRAVGTLPDGRIFVGDEQAHTIRIFSSDGDYLAAVGGEGEGPGELQWFLTVARYRGDSLWVYDYRQRAVSVFGPDLGFGRRFRNPMTAGNYWIVSSLEDGRFILYSPGPNRRDAGPGIVPDSSAILVSSPDGSALDTIGRFQVRMLNLGPDGRSLHLYPAGSVQSRADRVVVLEGVRFEYRELLPNGDVARIVRREVEPVPVTSEIIDDYKEHYAEWLGASPEGGAEGIRRSLEEGQYAAQLPATGWRLLTDPHGNVWVSTYHFPGAQPEQWAVFSAEGVWLGMVEAPPGLEIKEIGESQVLGVALDDFDVPYVQVHRLDRRRR